MTADDVFTPRDRDAIKKRRREHYKRQPKRQPDAQAETVDLTKEPNSSHYRHSRAK